MTTTLLKKYIVCMCACTRAYQVQGWESEVRSLALSEHSVSLSWHHRVLIVVLLLVRISDYIDNLWRQTMSIQQLSPGHLRSASCYPVLSTAQRLDTVLGHTHQIDVKI